jgi:hypothetical protein
MNKKWDLIILSMLILVFCVNIQVVISEDYKITYEVYKVFDIKLQPNENKTMSVSDYLNIALFNESDYALFLRFYTQSGNISFNINTENLTLIHIYQEIKFLDNETISSYSMLTYPSKFHVVGTTVAPLSQFTRITTKNIINLNNYTINVKYNIGIIEEFHYIETTTVGLNAICIITTAILLGIKSRLKKIKNNNGVKDMPSLDTLHIMKN